jgi:predicted nuclease of restriction endonuclease-like RecB superfamily
LLTADLARVRRAGDELKIWKLNAEMRTRAFQLATEYLKIAETHMGRTRAEFEEVCRQVPIRNSEWKLAGGLRKLVEDRCHFEITGDTDPLTLRSEVFLAASAKIRNLPDGERFDRSQFISEQAAAHEINNQELERVLYADLRSQHVLLTFDSVSPEQLMENYESAQAQAVLLRATKVTAVVQCSDPHAYRALFRKLKFLRLLHRITSRADGGYQIEIDGPFSMFSSVTKYGLQLALALPAIQACDVWKVAADVRWGKERKPFLFRLKGRSSSGTEAGVPALPDEVQTLLDRLKNTKSDWLVESSSDILELPGVGMCVPDLRFENRYTGEIAYLEVMGYWSRDAVWNRVELVQQGLPYRVLFAVSSRLRVSEAVLDKTHSGELYVYKSSISVKEILKRLQRNSSSTSIRG